MWSRYRPSVAQRVGRGIALLFHDRGTRRGWVVSVTPRPQFTHGKDPVPILQEAGWAPGPVWTGGKSRSQRDSIPYRPARSQSLYRLSYPVLTTRCNIRKFYMVLTLRLCVLYGSQNRERLLPYPSLTDRFCVTVVGCLQRGTDCVFV